MRANAQGENDASEQINSGAFRRVRCPMPRLCRKPRLANRPEPNLFFVEERRQDLLKVDLQ